MPTSKTLTKAVLRRIRHAKSVQELDHVVGEYFLQMYPDATDLKHLGKLLPIREMEAGFPLQHLLSPALFDSVGPAYRAKWRELEGEDPPLPTPAMCEWFDGYVTRQGRTIMDSLQALARRLQAVSTREDLNQAYKAFDEAEGPWLETIKLPKNCSADSAHKAFLAAAAKRAHEENVDMEEFKRTALEVIRGHNRIVGQGDA